MRKQQQRPQPPASEPEKFEHWTAQRKVAIILEVLKGQISVPEARSPRRLCGLSLWTKASSVRSTRCSERLHSRRRLPSLKYASQLNVLRTSIARDEG